MNAQATVASEAAGAQPLAELSALIRERLLPRVEAIDLAGEYPEDFLRSLGAAGGFGRHVRLAGGPGALIDLIEVMAKVSEACLTTGFLVWCQGACAWYLAHTDNEGLRSRMLPDVTSARVLAGTGLSNPMKACAGIEPVRLKARRVGQGYQVNGVLPWVSNLGPGHVFACAAQVEGESGLLVALISCDTPGIDLRANAHFVALEGSRTFACHFRDVYVPDADVLAHPDEFPRFLARIKAGFVLSQMGMGLGLVQGCLTLIEEAGQRLQHVNCYLDGQPEELRTALDAAWGRTRVLAEAVSKGEAASTQAVLSLRADAAMLAMRAAEAAMLHSGAKGYLRTHPAQRRLREAFFLAIVTPALKHLRKELATLAADKAASTCRVTS